MSIKTRIDNVQQNTEIGYLLDAGYWAEDLGYRRVLVHWNMAIRLEYWQWEYRLMHYAPGMEE